MDIGSTVEIVDDHEVRPLNGTIKGRHSSGDKGT
jgi:hypothetical protein